MQPLPTSGPIIFGGGQGILGPLGPLAAVCPVSLADFKAHLRIDPTWTADDATLTAYLSAALDYVERETRLQLMPRNWLLTLDSFPQRRPWGSDECHHPDRQYCFSEREIVLPKPPLQSVASIQYIDVNGVPQVLPTSVYVADVTVKPGRIVLNAGQFWPDTMRQQPNSVAIVFTAGYGVYEGVPPLLLHCIKFMVGHYYENREGAIDRRIDAVPMAVDSIIQAYMYPETRGCPVHATRE